MLVPLDIASITRSSITNSTILGHSTSRMLLERYAHESDARKQAVIAANPGTVGHVLGTPGWAEETVWRQSDEKNEEKSGGRQEARTPDLRVANARLEHIRMGAINLVSVGVASSSRPDHINHPLRYPDGRRNRNASSACRRRTAACISACVALRNHC
jgi:hypothetical protein